MTALADLLDAYAAARASVVVAPTRMATTIAPLRRHLGGLEADALGRAATADYLGRRVAEGVQPATVRRELITLRAALRLAWQEGVISAPPQIGLPPPGPGRQRALNRSEVAHLRAAVANDADMEVLVALLIGTGARLGAVLDLTWDRVDLRAGQIDYRAPHPRAGRRKHRAVVPITGRLLALLRAHQRLAGDPARGPVVELGRSTVERRFRAAAQAAGLPGVTPHVLRHTAATHLLRSVRLVEASRLLGHRSTAITEQVYGHLAVADLLPAAQALDEWMGEGDDAGGR